MAKYELLRQYDHMFATGMKDKWNCRIYVDLFAGPGHSVIKGSRLRVAGSPVIAANTRNPFDRYVFCEENAESLKALRTRIERLGLFSRSSFIHGNCNDRVDEVVAGFPRPSTSFKVLTFCFVDPTNLDIRFETIRKLASYRTDFLVLLAAGTHGGRNWRHLLARGNHTLNQLFGTPDWLVRLGEAKGRIGKFRLFLAHEFARQMVSQLGYLDVPLDSRTREVRSTDKNLRLYYLLFFSKHPLGHKLWDQAQKGTGHELDLFEQARRGLK